MARNSQSVDTDDRGDEEPYDEDDSPEWDDEDAEDGSPDEAPEGNGEVGNARQAAQVAVDYIDEMTGEPPEVVTGVVREEGGWLVTVEVLELGRVPNTTDVLGCYQVRVDADGEPVSYQRIRRYHRGQVGEG
jgi:hypothetical protein